MDGIEELNRRFSIPGIAQVVAGNGGLPKIHITTSGTSADLYLHGAHLTSWKPAGAEEVLFLSSQSHWEEGQAIRGGIPICFPWFRAKADNLTAPAHGFVRTKSWLLDSISADNVSATITLFTTHDETTKSLWPYEFRATYRVSIGTELKLELIIANTGAGPFRFEEALHTYHHVGQAEAVRIRGLDGVHFLDNTASNQEKVQHGDIVFQRTTDNAYLKTEHAVDLIDPLLQRRIRLAKENSQTTVVWNPWAEGARLLPDLANEEWRHMACVEASNMSSFAVTLPPGQEHTMKARIQVAELGG